MIDFYLTSSYLSLGFSQEPNFLFFLLRCLRPAERNPTQAIMALWNGVGQVANIAQLTGVDAYGLISMIVEAAKTIKRNQETCQLLARRVRMIGDLMQQLQSSQLMQHVETRNPMEQLEETLRHAYLLIASCQDSSYLHSCFMGGSMLSSSVRCRMRSHSTSSSSPSLASLTPPVTWSGL